MERSVRIRLRRTRRGPKNAAQHRRTQIDVCARVLRQGFSFDTDSSGYSRWRAKCEHNTINVSSYLDGNCRYWRNRRVLTSVMPAIEGQLPTNHIRAERNIAHVEGSITRIVRRTRGRDPHVKDRIARHDGN